MNFYSVHVQYFLEDEKGKLKRITEKYLIEASTNEEASRICTSKCKFPEADSWLVLNTNITNFISIVRQSDITD